ncbi:hypothetical protein EBR21_00365 [bacterium]|nr:hypothetical protein [bacterium]
MANPEELLLSSGQSRLSISPGIGKITQLHAKGENLLVAPLPQDLPEALCSDGRSSFQSPDAWGCDECFPTIGGSALWQLRDHGDLWAQTPHIFYAQENSCLTGWKSGKSQFKRIVAAQNVSGQTKLLGAYGFQVTFPILAPLMFANEKPRSDMTLKSIYASHALFSAEPGDRIEWSVLPGVTTLETALTQPYSREVLSAKVFAEDNAPIGSKFYLQTDSSKIFATSLIRKRAGLRIDVLQDASLPWVGIWWCHNGWGDGRPHSTVGIEPTNIPSDGPVLNLTGLDLNSETTAQFFWIISEI